MRMWPHLREAGGTLGKGEAAFGGGEPALGGGEIAARDGAVHLREGAARGGVVSEGLRHCRQGSAFGPARAARDDQWSPLQSEGPGRASRAVG